MMDTVLFTDHSIVVFVILTSAIALIFSDVRTCNDAPDTLRHERQVLP